MNNDFPKIYRNLYSKEFEDFCRQQIIPILRNRKKYIKGEEKNKKFNYIYPVLFVPIFIFVFFFYMSLSIKIVLSFSIIFIIFLTVLLFQIVYKEFIQYQEKKNRVLSKLFSLFSNFKYITSKNEIKIFQNYLNKISLFKNYQENICIQSEDFFKIKYNKLDIDLCEVVLHTRSGKHDEYNSAIFYRIKTKKEFSSKTTIQRRTSPITSILQENVLLESKEFNNTFKVKTSNQTEARLFLTPAFMERLLRFYSFFCTRDFAISFEYGYMNIYIQTKDYNSFEINNTNSYRTEECIDTLRKAIIDLKKYLSFLDDLEIENII